MISVIFLGFSGVGSEFRILVFQHRVANWKPQTGPQVVPDQYSAQQHRRTCDRFDCLVKSPPNLCVAQHNQPSAVSHTTEVLLVTRQKNKLQNAASGRTHPRCECLPETAIWAADGDFLPVAQ